VLFKAIVTNITAIEELAGVTILCSSTLAYHKQAHHQQGHTINASVVGALHDTGHARAGIKLLYFKPFNPVNKCTLRAKTPMMMPMW